MIKKYLKKYNEIWDENKVNYLKKIFIVNHCIKNKYIKTKINCIQYELLW